MELTDKNKSLLIKSIGTLLILRLVLAAWIPMTGDEAYFITWGKHLDYGFYDHTAIVGWLLGAFLSVSDAAWWLRLPAVLLPLVLAWGIYKILLPRNPQAAPWVALAFLAAPINVINVLITHDIPLIYFSFASAWFFYRALYVNTSYKSYLLSGLFLGLAFFSKYFAVLLGVAYGFYIVFFRRDKKAWLGLLLIFLMVLPFALLNLIWNYNNCWNNILFNLFNRTAAPDNVGHSFVNYLVMMVYLLSPVLLYFVYKNRKLFKQEWQDKFNQTYLWLIGFPLFLFFLIMFRKEIGLHWVLSFYPFAFIALAGLLTVQQWRWTTYFMAVLSVLHVAGIGTVLLLPETTFVGKKEAVQNLTFGKHPQELLARLEPYKKEYQLAAISYGIGSLLYYHSREHVMIFGRGSFHARQDDSITDFSKLDGKNILIIKRTPQQLDPLGAYFASFERKQIKVREATFELLLGKGFNYQKYRDEILYGVNRDFYAIPKWLPVGQCEFKKKYHFN